MNPYDKFLYPSYAYPQSHPDNLATLATLFGMEHAPADRCRVLELGCGSGGNIIPMALGLPESRFVGIDLAEVPITEGQAMINTLCLKNIILRKMDIMDVSAELGQFDYIIAHGLFSWVPPLVQDKIFSICKDLLLPNGIAYISYNTYPGYHLQGMVREIMRFHSTQIDEPKEKISHALNFVKFLSESIPDNTYRLILKEAVEQMGKRRDEGIYHDELAEFNLPVYFYSFMERAENHGLQYLSEANFYDMQESFPSEVTDTLSTLAKDRVVLKEQYLDFLKCRRFRRSLLCRQGLNLNRTPQPEQMYNFYIASSAQTMSQLSDITSETEEEFRNAQGASMKTGHPLAKAAIAELANAWPASLDFHELLNRVRNRFQGKNVAALEGDETSLSKIILWTYAAGLVELHTYQPAFTLDISERPVASPLARLQLLSGNRITNLRHTSVQMEGPLEQRLLLLLDGTRDRTAILNELANLVESGAASLRMNDVEVRDRSEAIDILSKGLETSLKQISRLALLVE